MFLADNRSQLSHSLGIERLSERLLDSLTKRLQQTAVWYRCLPHQKLVFVRFAVAHADFVDGNIFAADRNAVLIKVVLRFDLPVDQDAIALLEIIQRKSFVYRNKSVLVIKTEC